MKRRAGGLQFGRQRKKVNIPLIKEIFGWIISVVVVVYLAFVFVFYIGQKTTMVGKSMSPTLEDGEKILINRFLYKISDPKANDVIVFLPNGNKKSHPYVKRVIGVPGDKVQIKDGTVYINGEPFKEENAPAAIESAGIADEEIVLGKEEYFVLGDNRNNSEDSRYVNIGNVRKDYIIGKVWLRVGPLKKFGVIN